MVKCNQFKVIEQAVWLNFSYLLTLGVPKGTLDNSKSRFKLKRTKDWKYFVDVDGSTYFALDHIPPGTIKKHKIPDETEFLSKIHSPSENAAFSLLEETKIRSVFFVLENAANFKWVDYQKFYPLYFYNNDLLSQLSRSHAILHELMAFSDAGETSVILFEAFKRLSTDIKLKFRTTAYSTFCDKLNQCKKDGIENVLPHKSHGSRYRLKLSTEWQREITTLYASPRKYSITQVVELINQKRFKAGLSALSRTTIADFLNSPEIRNMIEFPRNGYRRFREQIVPDFQLKARYANEIWVIDGSPLSFATSEGDQFLWDLISVVDWFSRKIIGYCIVPNENTSGIILALKNAMIATGAIPNLLLSDKFSAYKSEIFNHFSDRLRNLRTDFRHSFPGEPEGRGVVERVFKTLDTKNFKKIKFHFGQGIRSKSQDSRPSDEQTILNRKKENLRTLKEIEEIIVRGIYEYNTDRALKYGMPNKNYDDSIDVNRNTEIRWLEDSEFAYLFFESCSMQIVKNTIKFNRNDFQGHFQIPYEFTRQLNRTRVDVYFDTNHEDLIYLFSKKQQGKFLCTAERQSPIPVNPLAREDYEKEMVSERNQFVRQFLRENEDFLLPDSDREAAIMQSKGKRFFVEGTDPKKKTKSQNTSLPKKAKDNTAERFNFKKIKDL